MALLTLIRLGCLSYQTLAECTADMDPDTWNAYHIVSNRARAVCYSTRQMQFKRRTEHTVNTLVSAAVNQLEAMRLLKVGSDERAAPKRSEPMSKGQTQCRAQPPWSLMQRGRLPIPACNAAPLKHGMLGPVVSLRP